MPLASTQTGRYLVDVDLGNATTGRQVARLVLDTGSGDCKNPHMTPVLSSVSWLRGRGRWVADKRNDNVPSVSPPSVAVVVFSSDPKCKIPTLNHPVGRSGCVFERFLQPHGSRCDSSPVLRPFEIHLFPMEHRPDAGQADKLKLPGATWIKP